MRSGFRARLLLFAAPLSAVLIVVLGVVSGGERPFQSARVYGGPTQSVADLSLRVELGQRDRVAEVPLVATAFRLRVIEGGHAVAEAQGKTDALGIAELMIRLPRPRDSALEIWVEPAASIGAPFARGLVLGTLDSFQATLRRRGGFQPGKLDGDVALSVAAARGALVMAQGALDEELVVRAQRGGAPLAGAALKVEVEGAEVAVRPIESALLTDERGLARVTIRPREPHIRIAVEARAGDGATGSFAGRLDVVQGAIRATQQPQGLLLESTGATDRAFVGFFDESRRHAGLHALLKQAPDGRMFAEVPWPKGVPRERIWMVTSSQADLGSPGALGWPVVSVAQPAPTTLDARELLLLDGAPAARLREERRARRVRVVTAAYAALALAVTLWLFVRRVRESDSRIQRHLSRAGMQDEALHIAPARGGRMLLATACIGLGFLVLALVALLKD